jgi:hypothetical protein
MDCALIGGDKALETLGGCQRSERCALYLGTPNRQSLDDPSSLLTLHLILTLPCFFSCCYKCRSPIDYTPILFKGIP